MIADLKERVETYLAQVQRNLHLPGLSISIVQHGEVVYTAGLGMASPGRAVSPRTPFILGSLSKSFTALAIMQLVECGKLRLDDPVQQHIPWFTVASPDVAHMTVRHLLTHTSGLSCYAGRNLLSGRGNKSVEQSVHDLAGVKLVHTPGAHFEYSNSNYLMLTLLIEVVSRQSYPSYMEEHVFKPLLMHDSFVSHVAAAPALAQGYRWWFGLPLPFHAPYLYDAQGAAFLISSAADMARWLLLHLGDGSLDGVRLLSPAGMEEMHRPQMNTKKGGSQAALGWRVKKLTGESLLRHGGEVSNFRAEMMILLGRKLGVVVLANCNNGVVAHLGLDQMADNVMRLLLGLPVPTPRLTFSRFYAGLNVVLLLLTLLQVGVWTFLALSAGPTMALALILTLDLLWPFLVLFWFPCIVDMPWRGLRLYVPDLAYWLGGISVVTVVLNVMILLKWFL
ncbi:MAG: beta-lactamase family protein [Ktedonobacteraceae bacterium]|nr:beta-lactamase family protein [Ktedonobacteraceae bacterium]